MTGKERDQVARALARVVADVELDAASRERLIEAVAAEDGTLADLLKLDVERFDVLVGAARMSFP